MTSNVSTVSTAYAAAAVVLASVGFWAPVTFARPGDDLKPEILKFRARFRHLKKSARQDLDRRINALRMTPEIRAELQAQCDDQDTPEYRRKELRLALAARPILDIEVLETVLIDWELKDRHGAFVACTPANIVEQEEELDGIVAAMVLAYGRAKNESTRPEVVAKNSEEPSATGS